MQSATYLGVFSLSSLVISEKPSDPDFIRCAHINAKIGLKMQSAAQL